jgi:hypothetical protein
MERIEVVLSTTHVDRHNERFSVGALESMVEQVQSNIFPMGVEHDPRIPPVGRIVDAELREREDGEYQVVGTVEIFESGDEIPSLDRDRTVPVRSPDTEGLQAVYDRSYRGEDDQQTIKELVEILGTEPKEEGKKSYEVLSVLTIAGLFMVGRIAGGFFKEMGADAYKSFKSKVKGLLDRKADERDERLMKFNPTVKVDDRLVEIEVILTNPTDDEIESFFEEGLQELDDIIPNHIRDESINKIVYEYEGRSITVNFGLREDGIPVSFPSSNS